MAADTREMVAVRYVRNKIVAASTEAGSQIYTGVAVQGAAYPFVVVEIVSRDESETQDSGSAVDTFRVQVDCYAKSDGSTSGYEKAARISDQIRSALSRSTDYTTYDCDIDGVQEAGHLTDYIPEIEVYRATNDYMIRIK